MPEMRFRFVVTVTRRFLLCALAASMMLTVVPELNSESVTQVTYYPAPSGVYTRMITTGDTFLARDAAAVGVYLQGTAPIPTDASGRPIMLDVRGGGIALASDTNISFARSVGAVRYNVISALDFGLLRMGDMGNAFGGVMFDAGGVSRMILDANGRLGIGTMAPGHELDVAGGATASQLITTTASGNDCVERQYNQGVTNCPGQRYATLTSGVIAKYTITADQASGETGGGNMLCCTCPAGGCPL